MFKPWMTGSLLLMCVVLGILLGRSKPPVFGAPVEELAGNVPRNNAKEMLGRRISEINAVNEPLESVLQKLVAASGVALSVQWPPRGEYEAAPEVRTMPVTVHVWNVNVEQALTRILHRTGLTFAAGDGVIVVSDEEIPVREERENRIYNIRDIIKSGRLGDITRSLEDAYLDPVCVAVANGSRLNDHPRGGFGDQSFTNVMGLLVITETPENQAKVAAFLERLRASNDEQSWRSATRPATSSSK